MAETKVWNDRKFILAEVAQVHDVTPLMRRITVAAAGLRHVPVAKPAQWMKLLFPAEPGQKRVGRAYTIRHFDPAAARMEFDFVLHGDSGPASKWAGAARPGDQIEVAGPSTGYDIDPNKPQILIGDATSLPAIAAIIEALPEALPVRALIEVENLAEQQILSRSINVETIWVHSGAKPPGTSGALERVLRQAVIDPRHCQIWLAGESMMLRAIRLHLLKERQVPPDAIQASGYWKAGASDHREPD